ncbi:MAG: hypothetical protein OEP95_04065, partial [Myxococcales bacterium]|nr:hypothetical protein [Myxococcales bacterium]
MIPADEQGKRFELHRGGAIEVCPSGVRHPRSPRLGGWMRTAWGDVTHVAVSRAGLRLGTRKGV